MHGARPSRPPHARYGKHRLVAQDTDAHRCGYAQGRAPVQSDPGRLRTIVSAHRHGSSGDTLSLISDNLPRAAWPPPADPSGGTLAIDTRAGQLLDAARPSATMVRKHDVEIAFDGANIERDRLGAAIELAAHWASSARDSGPYR